MSTMTGRITQVDTKQSKKGNTYHRLNIESSNGSRWWTYFGILHGEYMNAECTFVVKPMGDGEIIDDYSVNTPGQAPYQAPATPSAPSAPSSAAPHHTVPKDLFIFAEVVFQHWVGAGVQHLEPADIKQMIAHSVDAALFADKVFQTYGTQGDADARKLILSALDGTPERKVAEMHEQAVQRSTEPEADFDDDMPF